MEKSETFTRAQLLFSFLYKHEKELDFLVFLFANRVHKHTFSYKFTNNFTKRRRGRNLSTHTHTRTLVAIQKVQSFVRFVKDTVSCKRKKEEIEHIYTEKNTYSRFRKI